MLKTPAGDVYRFRAFTLDPKRRAVLRDGSLIAVTPKAFDILLYLVEHPNCVVSKQDIMKAVWPDTIVEEANLTVNMSLLRKALAERDDDRLIVTVARQGYQFAAEVTREPYVEAAPVRPRSDSQSRRRRVAGFGLVGLAVLLVAASIAWSRRRGDPGDPVRLAVLPFENLTGDSTRNYLADGLTEELITRLARLEPSRLGVIARTSVIRYRHGDERLDQIGRDLSVRYAIESSLRQSADRLRVSVRLVETNDQRDLWASDFDYGVQDVFRIEDSVAASVARAVQLRLSPAVRARLTETGSPDPIAADEVMHGRDLYRYTDTRDGWAAALRYFRLAIVRDSNYALAWSWFGAAYRYGAGRGFVASDSAIPIARTAIDRALALDPNLPEAWEQRGQLERLVDWDWAAAARSFNRAVALDPENSEAIEYSAGIQISLGHLDEALALLHRAMELDPVDPYLRGYPILVEYVAGHLDKALKMIETIPPDARNVEENDVLANIYIAKGRLADAAAIVPRVVDTLRQLPLGARLLYAQGRGAAADSALASLIPRLRDDGAFQIAEVYAFRGERDSAFKWLDRAYARHDQGLASVKIDPVLTNLRGDPRYVALLTEMRLPN